jgi:AraC-like DNA-binding protein
LVCGAPRQRRSVAKDRLGAALFTAFLAKAPGSRCLFEAELLRRLLGEGIGRSEQRLRPRERLSLRSLVAQQVEQRPGRRLKLGEFSEMLGCHPGSLSARFRREEGMTFSRALLHARLENVRPLLESGRPLAELAEACGYADAFAFSKAWKTCFGAAPRGTQGR